MFGVFAEDTKELTKRYTNSEIFEIQCPQFLAMGMSYSDYWDGEIDMCKYYIEAYEIKKREDNRNNWLLGSYIYEALLCVSPMFGFQPQEPKPYREEPYPLSLKEQREMEERKRVKEREEFKRLMNARMETINKKFQLKNREV